MPKELSVKQTHTCFLLWCYGALNAVWLSWMITHLAARRYLCWDSGESYFLAWTHVTLLFVAYCLLMNFKEAFKDLAQNKSIMLASQVRLCLHLTAHPNLVCVACFSLSWTEEGTCIKKSELEIVSIILRVTFFWHSDLRYFCKTLSTHYM